MHPPWAPPGDLVGGSSRDLARARLQKPGPTSRRPSGTSQPDARARGRSPPAPARFSLDEASHWRVYRGSEARAVLPIQRPLFLDLQVDRLSRLRECSGRARLGFQYEAGREIHPGLAADTHPESRSRVFTLAARAVMEFRGGPPIKPRDSLDGGCSLHPDSEQGRNVDRPLPGARLSHAPGTREVARHLECLPQPRTRREITIGITALGLDAELQSGPITPESRGDGSLEIVTSDSHIK